MCQNIDLSDGEHIVQAFCRPVDEVKQVALAEKLPKLEVKDVKVALLIFEQTDPR